VIREYGLAGRRLRIAAPRRVVGSAQTRRFTRFGLVGLTGVVINMVLLYLLVGAAHMQHLVAAALGTEAAIVSNFAWNDRWTFHDALGDRTWLARLCRYNAVSLSGLGISLLVIAVLTDRANMYYLVANLVAIAAATMWNYAVNARLTWRLPAPMKAQPVICDSDLSLADPAAMGGH
jgi:dolichol-phosphate mannosyltransferase